jgi:hypothetical protein
VTTPHNRDTAPSAGAEDADASAQVSVTLDSCCKEDAQAVLAALHASFPSDRSPEDRPADAADGRPVVWTKKRKRNKKVEKNRRKKKKKKDIN